MARKHTITEPERNEIITDLKHGWLIQYRPHNSPDHEGKLVSHNLSLTLSGVIACIWSGMSMDERQLGNSSGLGKHLRARLSSMNVTVEPMSLYGLKIWKVRIIHNSNGSPL